MHYVKRDKGETVDQMVAANTLVTRRFPFTCVFVINVVLFNRKPCYKATILNNSKAFSTTVVIDFRYYEFFSTACYSHYQ